jgi:hypothetical protein
MARQEKGIWDPVSSYQQGGTYPPLILFTSQLIGNPSHPITSIHPITTRPTGDQPRPTRDNDLPPPPNHPINLRPRPLPLPIQILHLQNHNRQPSPQNRRHRRRRPHRRPPRRRLRRALPLARPPQAPSDHAQGRGDHIRQSRHADAGEGLQKGQGSRRRATRRRFGRRRGDLKVAVI